MNAGQNKTPSAFFYLCVYFKRLYVSATQDLVEGESLCSLSPHWKPVSIQYCSRASGAPSKNPACLIVCPLASTEWRGEWCRGPRTKPRCVFCCCFLTGLESAPLSFDSDDKHGNYLELQVFQVVLPVWSKDTMLTNLCNPFESLI